MCHQQGDHLMAQRQVQPQRFGPALANIYHRLIGRHEEPGRRSCSIVVSSLLPVREAPNPQKDIAAW